MSDLHEIFQRFPREHGNAVHTYELTAVQTRLFADRLNKFMSEAKPFLRLRYGIRDLARDLNVPSYQLSAFINREIGSNFNDYLNHYRVKYCEELMQKGEINQMNLKGIARQCGFTHRNTLSNAFKKFTGFTPSRYQKGWESLLTMEMTD